ncbi:MAG: hypothetical protein JG774_1615 [Desulfomicrobiaceae bacterium]|jgi:hypothetical protein|nr:hypothetical protein [Desulfomicrobiaceae bacterium]MBZ4648288.1 hypothetical protein [Desulfomicrobiaceae bacterium]MBZ4685870.1 hypothetical protein [Desulfomicrobiaceae bacterium]HCF04833.1 hypothetical protein [Desulfomicrobiaceae bacterium]
MAYDIRLVKLVGGDMVLGKWNAEREVLQDPAVLQTLPTAQGGVQMLLLPFGYPFDTEIEGEIDGRHIIYHYKSVPEELKTKYLEASSNLTLATPGSLDLSGLGGKVTDFGKIIK